MAGSGELPHLPKPACKRPTRVEALRKGKRLDVYLDPKPEKEAAFEAWLDAMDAKGWDEGHLICGCGYKTTFISPTRHVTRS